MHECWDAEKRKPSNEYSAVIRKFKTSMKGLGVELKPES